MHLQQAILNIESELSNTLQLNNSATTSFCLVYFMPSVIVMTNSSQTLIKLHDGKYSKQNENNLKNPHAGPCNSHSALYNNQRHCYGFSQNLCAGFRRGGITP